MNCQRCRIEIEELETGGRLSEETRAHLLVCPLCHAFDDERQALKNLIGSLGAVAAPPDFDFRLRARLAAAKSRGERRPSWRSFLASAPAIGLAATFALLVAGFVLYNQVKSGPTAVSQPNELARETQAQRPEAADASTGDAGSRPAGAPVSPVVSPSETTGGGTTVVDGGKDVRPRPSRKSTVPRNASTPLMAQTPQGVSNDIAGRTATVITPDNRQPSVAAANPVVELPVRSAAQPVRVSLDDRSGARRTVTLEPVIFGSQDLAGRSISRAAPQDIW